jgi:3-oxoacyl-[acyl-carrier protein] reductase
MQAGIDLLRGSGANRRFMNTGLDGQVVLVTGASGGIGSAIARGFAAEGARLVLHYRSQRQSAEALGKALAAAGAEVLVTRADLRREADTRAMFRRAVRRFGRVDTLIANAGSWETRDVPLPEMSLAQWRTTLDGVLTSTFLCLREFLQLVGQRQRGNAVLIASTAGVFGEAGHADYAAAKSAMAFGLTRSLKNEIARLAPHTGEYCGGRVNCVCPGWTVVPRTARKLRDEATVRRVTATMALPQIARPEDIANAVVFLSSDRLCRHVTGQTLVVAGGMEGRWLWRPEEVDASIV